MAGKWHHRVVQGALGRRLARTQAGGVAGAALTLKARLFLIPVAALAALGLLASLALIAMVGRPTSGIPCTSGTAAARQIPARFLATYAQAAHRYDLGRRGPAVLASMHRTESQFGVNQGPSSAGAEGHMQFMPSTWSAYGVDADHDGTRDPRDATDAIFSAARYLRASGAPRDWRRAIFAYNHADWYVRDILDGANGFQGLCEQRASRLGPLPADRLERLTYVATWIDRRNEPYCWGGGHAPQTGPSGGSYCWTATNSKQLGSRDTGLDCSGAVRWLLALTGYRDTGPIVSSDFASAYEPGRGQTVTIWSNASHVFVHVRGRGYWGTSSGNYRHGPSWMRTYPTAGFTPSHPSGL